MESVTDEERKRKEISNAVSFDCFGGKNLLEQSRQPADFKFGMT
jgi:hypothetical protein